MGEAVIFDTEFTAWPGSVARKWTAPGEFREIIQIGAIKIDVATLEEISAFSVLVRPVLNPELSDYITRLTGITQEALARDGVSLPDAVRRFLDFVGGAKMCCYGYDGWIIAKNLALLGQPDVWPGFRPLNIGDWFEASGVDVTNMNSGGLATLLGAEISGSAHEAVYDCRSIASAMRVLVGRGVAHPLT
jgi:inhibitor of KinA sporulation pathway (predicted exonuclease)